MSMNLSKNQIESFNEHGYLILDNFLPSELLDDFKNEYEKLIVEMMKRNNLDPDNFDSIFDDGLVALEKIDHFIIAQIYDISAQTPSFLRIAGYVKTQQTINELMERDSNAPLYTFTNRCRIDMPSDERRTYGWHQEVFYTIPKSRFLQTWCPLIRPTTKENGTIWVCDKSHKEGIAHQTWTDIPGRARQIIVNQEIVEKYNPIQLDMKLGQFLIFDSRLFHKSGANTTDETRFSLVGMYHDVSNNEFFAPMISFDYQGNSPKEFFDEQSKCWKQ